MDATRNQPQGFRFSLAELMALVVVVAVACRWPLTLGLAVPALAVYLAEKVARPTDSGRAPRFFYRVTLPTCWLLAAWASWNHPGDEYGMFLVSALPACWVAIFLSSSNLQVVLPPLFAAGTLTMVLGGWNMDRLRIRPLLWASSYLGGTIALVLWSLAEYPSYQKAMSKNGSLTAYVSAAANVSLYLSALGSFLGTALHRCIQLVRKPRNPPVESSSDS